MTEGISSSSSVNYASMLNSAANLNSSSATESSSSTSESSTQKSTNEILQELKQDGMSSTKSASDIAKEYGISLAKAQDILDELQGKDEELPEGSTVSYQVQKKDLII